MRFPILFSVSKKKLLLLGVSGLLVLGLILRLTVFGPHRIPKQTLNQSYLKESSQLDEAVRSLPATLELSGNVLADLDHYHQKMTSILNSCALMVGRSASATSTPGISNTLKDNISQSKQLCNDLAEVTKYSQALYDALHPYLLLNASAWPSPSDPAFKERLDAVQQTIINTRSAVGQVNNNVAQDPALPELITQLDQALEAAKKVEVTLKQGNQPQAADLAAQLLTETNQDKNDFLLARNYFWNNTILLNKLLAATKRLQNSFK